MTDGPSVRRLILDATAETAADHGIARLSVGDVARRAGLSRQTLYRHFASKELLVAACVADQSAALIQQVVDGIPPTDDPAAALEAAIFTALVATRRHPLLDRLLTTEPEALLPLLLSDGGPIMGQVRLVVEAITAERVLGQLGLRLDADDLRRFADLVTRLLISYAASPSDDPPAVIANTIANVLVHGALAGTATTQEPV